MKLFTAIILILLTACMTSEKLQKRTGDQLKELQNIDPKWSLKLIHSEPDARFTLLHIKQQHYSDILTKVTLKKIANQTDQKVKNELRMSYYRQLLKIDEVQKEIYTFVNEVCTNRDFLYVEGRSYPRHYRKEFLKTFTAETMKGAEDVLNGLRPVPDPPFFMGASLQLHKDEKLTVIGAENIGLLNLTLSLYENEKLSTSDLRSFLKECHEAREDQMLKNISIDFEDLPYRMSSIRFLLCGSKHNFLDNILEWNSNNPDLKFNLVEFTPELLR